MVYTVTFNPSLDYIVSVNDFQMGMTNRTCAEQMLPGGKGINVSTVLYNLGIETKALGFSAGFTGKEIELAADSICVHGDSPAALSFVKNIRQALTSHNIRIASIEETLANR